LTCAATLGIVLEISGVRSEKHNAPRCVLRGASRRGALNFMAELAIKIMESAAEIEWRARRAQMHNGPELLFAFPVSHSGGCKDKVQTCRAGAAAVESRRRE
jgi:hypothetical protein